MCGRMHMDFPSTKNLQACTDWTSFLLCSIHTAWSSQKASWDATTPTGNVWFWCCQ